VDRPFIQCFFSEAKFLMPLVRCSALPASPCIKKVLAVQLRPRLSGDAKKHLNISMRKTAVCFLLHLGRDKSLGKRRENSVEGGTGCSHSMSRKIVAKLV
jgi:hypothetical protein